MDDTMVVGFTGTQRGMTDEQEAALYELLAGGTGEFHHGDCIGADAQAATLARLIGARIVIHPPSNPSKRAFTSGDVLMPQKAYLERNRDIVDVSGLLIATPFGPEELRSGTWSTIRYAMRIGRPVVIIWPDGRVEWRVS